jgi:hypothetical protein
MLSPSERTKLITEIGTRLSNQDWPLIDLTLHQFSLPTEYDWRNSLCLCNRNGPRWI